MRALEMAALALVVAAAGCTLPGTGPTPTATPNEGVEVRVANEANATLTFDVWVMSGPVDEVRVRRADGTTETIGNLTAVAGLDLFEAEPGTTDVLFPGGATRANRYQLPTGSSVVGPVEDLPPQPVVGVVVEDGDGVVAWLLADCEDARLDSVDLEMRDRGPSASLGCGSFDGETRSLSDVPS